MSDETKMANPYLAIASAKLVSIEAGALTPAKPTINNLEERLRQFAYFTQENATEMWHAMLVWDLLDAVDVIARKRRADG
jgi:hypothetical protein